MSPPQRSLPPPSWPAGGSSPPCCPSGRPATGNGGPRAASRSRRRRPPGGYPPAPARPPSRSTRPGRSPTPTGTPGPRHPPPPATLPNRPARVNDSEGENPGRLVEPATAPERHPGCSYSRHHSKTPRQTHTAIPTPIPLTKHLTPKSDGVAVAGAHRMGGGGDGLVPERLGCVLQVRQLGPALFAAAMVCGHAPGAVRRQTPSTGAWVRPVGGGGRLTRPAGLGKP